MERIDDFLRGLTAQERNYVLHQLVDDRRKSAIEEFVKTLNADERRYIASILTRTTGTRPTYFIVLMFLIAAAIAAVILFGGQ